MTDGSRECSISPVSVAESKALSKEPLPVALLKSLLRLLFSLIAHVFIFLIYVVTIVPGTIISSIFPSFGEADKSFYVLGYSGTFYLVLGLGLYLCPPN
jgi:hypothetical protein